MNADKQSMLLYVITDRTWLGKNQLVNQVEEAVKGGATFIQLREKELDEEAFIKEALEIKKITDKYNVPYVINDNIQIALQIDADGVHVGQSDCCAKEVRRLIGENKILGVSVQTIEQAVRAQQDGADYIGVGAVFDTSTKQDAETLTFHTLKAICEAVDIPVVAIGGINAQNIIQLKESGIDGVAVISAIFSKPDIMKASEELYKLAKETVNA